MKDMIKEMELDDYRRQTALGLFDNCERKERALLLSTTFKEHSEVFWVGYDRRYRADKEFATNHELPFERWEEDLICSVGINEESSRLLHRSIDEVKGHMALLEPMEELDLYDSILEEEIVDEDFVEVVLPTTKPLKEMIKEPVFENSALNTLRQIKKMKLAPEKETESEKESGITPIREKSNIQSYSSSKSLALDSIHDNSVSLFGCNNEAALFFELCAFYLTAHHTELNFENIVLLATNYAEYDFEEYLEHSKDVRVQCMFSTFKMLTKEDKYQACKEIAFTLLSYIYAHSKAA